MRKERRVNAGLVIFLIVVGVNVAGLFLDLYLALSEMTTITDLAQEYGWVRMVIVAWQLVGVIALDKHFERPW